MISHWANFGNVTEYNYILSKSFFWIEDKGKYFLILNGDITSHQPIVGDNTENDYILCWLHLMVVLIHDRCCEYLIRITFNGGAGSTALLLPYGIVVNPVYIA